MTLPNAYLTLSLPINRNQEIEERGQESLLEAISSESSWCVPRGKRNTREGSFSGTISNFPENHALNISEKH
jgi:hypothetical protein